MTKKGDTVVVKLGKDYIGTVTFIEQREGGRISVFHNESQKHTWTWEEFIRPATEMEQLQHDFYLL